MNGTAEAHLVIAFGSWRLKSLPSSRRGFESCNRGDANCAPHLQRGTGCLPRLLAATRLDCWKTSRLTRRPMHDIWAAAFKNVESQSLSDSGLRKQRLYSDLAVGAEWNR